MNEKRLALGIREAAEAIGVSPGHIRNEIKRGNIKARHFGRRVIILVSELEAYLDSIPIYDPDHLPPGGRPKGWRKQVSTEPKEAVH